MTVREMFSLALILLVGLLVNRCAHLSGGQQVRLTRFPADSWRVHRLIDDSRHRGTVRRAERGVEEATDNIGEAWEGAERELDRLAAAAKVAPAALPAAAIYVLVLKPEQAQALEVKAPPPHLRLSWTGQASQVRVEIPYSAEDEAVDLVAVKPGEPTVTFRAPLESARLAMPQSISELHLAKPYEITLRGGPEALDIAVRRGDGAALERKDGTLLLATDAWEVTAEGVTGDVRMLDRRGRVLQRLEAGKQTTASESSNTHRQEGDDR